MQENEDNPYRSPNLLDPETYNRRHEVIGFYTHKWRQQNYGQFDPMTCIMPQVRHTLN